MPLLPLRVVRACVHCTALTQSLQSCPGGILAALAGMWYLQRKSPHLWQRTPTARRPHHLHCISLCVSCMVSPGYALGAVGGGVVVCACIGFTLIEPSSSLVWSLSLELTVRLGSVLGRSLTSAFRMLTSSSLRMLVSLCSSAW